MTTAVASGTLWGALSAVIGFITDKTGIKVMRGPAAGTASTNGKSITIPKLPDGMLSSREVVKVIAFIYHECAHVLWSDFIKRDVSPLHRALVGVLEDIRIEERAQITFPAARKYLSELVAIMTENGLAGNGLGFPPLKDEMSQAELLQWYILYRLRHDLLGQKGIAQVLPSAIDAANKKFPRGMMVRLDAMMFQIDQCQNTGDVYDLAAEIIKMIEEEQQSQTQPPTQGDDDDSSQDGASSQSPVESSSSDSSEQDGGGESGTSATQQQPEDGDQSTSNASSATSAGIDGSDSGAEDLAELLNMADKDVIESVGDMLGGELDQMSVQHRNAGHRATMPNVHPLNLAETQVDMVNLKGSVNATRTKTLNWLASAAQCDLQRDRKGILIDPTQLSQACVGGDIFAEESEGIDINAAISIVIDRSGSMSQLIRSAANAALATALAYDVHGIETQVSVFPVIGTGSDGDLDEGVAVIKRWGEKPRALASRIHSLHVDGGTPMAEAVMFAASDILRRQETLKLVIVVTDGDPDDKEATIQAISAARRNGVVVTGLGIGVDPSGVFGESFAGRLDSINNLSSVMTKLVKTSITGK